MTPGMGDHDAPESAIRMDRNERSGSAGTGDQDGPEYPVESATVVTDRMSGQSRGFGFVEMSTEAEAQAAIKQLHDQPFEGRKLIVNMAKGPGSGGARSSGGPPRSGGFGGPRKAPRW